jgi:shikimate kinase
MRISLIGYMGSGKSSVGRELANTLQIPFIDLDAYMEELNQLSISEIFSRFGEIKFRKLEKQALEEVLSLNQDFVLSVGGGTPSYYDNMDRIVLNTDSFYLRMSPIELKNRLIKEKKSRPLISRIQDEDLTEFIAKHLFERSQFYNKANTIVDVKEKSVKEIVTEIINQLPSHSQ